MPVGDDAMTPFPPDGIHGDIPGQNPDEKDAQRGVQADDPQLDQKSAGEHGNLFGNGQAQAA